ncbi:sensor histidine kinase [Saccharothrix algeriensis]|uniref:Two-component sensor histidine kinase n=1 Tax=Catellatospora bangladeshensis TaxID=310355 RepID=A0A8J3JE06_9ACTN|nr:two-component sensor histidine kinase [Catellatospora bangladeshensis]
MSYPPGPADAAAARRRGIRRGAVFAAIWLWPLATNVHALLAGQVAMALTAAAGLAAFAGLYLYVVVRGFSSHRPPTVRDRLLLAFLALLGLALAAGWGGQPGGWGGVILYVAAAGAALYRPPVAYLWLAGTVVARAAVGLAHGEPWPEIGESVFNLVMAAALVMVVRRLMHLVRQLRDTRDELARAAVERERLRFARDLHDLLGHSLSLIVVKAEVVRRTAGRDPDAAAREAVEIEQIGRTALTEVRQAVTGYRARAFTDELAAAGAALADAGIEPTVRVPAQRLPAAVDDAFAWAVREAATNVIRHSGATSCVIALSDTGGWQLEVRDDGRGPAPDDTRHGHGLRGLAERLALVGGTLSTVDLAGGGFVLRATAPAEAAS